ncbi:hypothetical protein [Caballeronia sp. LZ035]|uniref:hypothetical protein n=1 Tax=Caballeronia sp. LZ035 TaxID=3038568 RepID=UPI002861C907|nr:hypothetical protein [Caballeronia sp. LZ035]MDR5763427.1 hypothetical protein [Caballeronia sp. LZ035]
MSLVERLSASITLINGSHVFSTPNEIAGAVAQTLDQFRHHRPMVAVLHVDAYVLVHRRADRKKAIGRPVDPDDAMRACLRRRTDVPVEVLRRSIAGLLSCVSTDTGSGGWKAIPVTTISSTPCPPLPPIAVSTITLEGETDGVSPPGGRSTNATRFNACHENRIVANAAHNLPQEASDAFADATLDIHAGTA